jgi:cytochrome c551/c552
VLASLATSHKVGIAVIAGVFIAFALVSSFAIPSRWPNFPGRRVGWFVLVTALLTAGMLAAVIALAAEPKEERSAGGEETTTAQTTSAPTTTTTAPATKGDPAAGKALFGSPGCTACHTFKPAGSTAKVGPDLDKVADDAQKANHGSVDEYVAESIKDPNAYVVPGYPQGVMPSFSGLSDKQVADLVAFITTP